jgi:hypothetical protein
MTGRAIVRITLNSRLDRHKAAALGAPAGAQRLVVLLGALALAATATPAATATLAATATSAAAAAPAISHSSSTGTPSVASAAAGAAAAPPAVETSSWSGEVAWASSNAVTSFGHVTGAWVQPSVAPATSPEYADTWVGIDGYDGKLLQAGTTAMTEGGTVSYAAWFVAWTGTPKGMTVLSEPVAPGDLMDVAIERQASGAWYVELDDSTAGWTWSTTVTYPAVGSSAEWIEEAPGTWSTPSRFQTLADYGSVAFSTVRADGTSPRSLTAFEIEQNGSVVSYPATSTTAKATFSAHYGAPAPTVQRVSPPSGPASGGSLVVLSGANFGASPVVRFGNVEASIVSRSTSSIVVRAPPHLPGAVAVTVGGASSPAASPRGPKFAYTAPKLRADVHATPHSPVRLLVRQRVAGARGVLVVDGRRTRRPPAARTAMRAAAR